MSENLGHDFNLPDEILSVIPTDPYDQLDLARKITSMAIASRVSNLESETGRLRQSLNDKDRVIVQLEEKAAALEGACQDAQVQLRIVTEDNMKLLRERDSFAMTAKKLSRDLAKLETFKRQLMQSLSEDDSSQAETVDIETCEQIPKAYPTTEVNNGYTIQRSLSGSTDSSTITDALMQTGQRASITPYITPRLTPTATPKVYSTNGSPRRYSSIESPQSTSGATSPTKSLYDGRASLSSWYPSSQQSSAASSPPHGRSTTVRGYIFGRYSLGYHLMISLEDILQCVCSSSDGHTIPEESPENIIGSVKKFVVLAENLQLDAICDDLTKMVKIAGDMVTCNGSENPNLYNVLGAHLKHLYLLLEPLQIY